MIARIYPRALALLSLLALFFGPPALAQSEDDQAAVLAANSEFYRAFRESDHPAMKDIWAETGPMAVEHPSTGRIEGRERVIASWERMMMAPPRITCALESIGYQDGLWGVVCNEQLNPGSVRMINIFKSEDGEWRMVYHGPAPDVGPSS
ncbi:MAG: nuclear transport factor 2 family protein [Pseudomonadota bacterium]